MGIRLSSFKTKTPSLQQTCAGRRGRQVSPEPTKGFDPARNGANTLGAGYFLNRSTLFYAIQPEIEKIDDGYQEID